MCEIVKMTLILELGSQKKIISRLVWSDCWLRIQSVILGIHRLVHTRCWAKNIKQNIFPTRTNWKFQNLVTYWGADF